LVEHVKQALSQGILTLTIARADKKNALTNDMYGALADALTHAEKDDAIRVVLIQADGDMFTAGNDLAEFAEQSAGNGPEELQVVRFVRALANATVTIVAAVNGKAVGIGTTMLLHCDHVLLADDAQLITPFVNLALVPEAASSYLLPLTIGHVKAFEMFALGDPVDAATAVSWGIANRVVPAATLRVEAQHVAERFASKPVGSLTAMKRLMRDAARITDQVNSERFIFRKRLKSAEAKEAFAAFAEKRKPDFTKISG
jgi:enoyl-CoA hydratase/carnithine racemase